MSQTVTLTVSEDAVRRIKDIADLTHRRFEDVMVELLSDEQVLALCDLQMNIEDDTDLSRLLADSVKTRLMILDALVWIN